MLVSIEVSGVHLTTDIRVPKLYGFEAYFTDGRGSRTVYWYAAICTCVDYSIPLPLTLALPPPPFLWGLLLTRDSWIALD